MQAETLPRQTAGVPAPFRRPRQDHWLVRGGLTAATLAIVGVLIVVPLVSVFAQALSDGIGVYWDSLIGNADTRHSILLTITVAPVAVALNLVFGVAAAWCIARFRFPGRTLLTTVIDLPFRV